MKSAADKHSNTLLNIQLIFGTVMTIAYLSAGFFLIARPTIIPEKPRWVGLFVGSMLIIYSFLRARKVYISYKALQNENESTDEE